MCIYFVGTLSIKPVLGQTGVEREEGGGKREREKEKIKEDKREGRRRAERNIRWAKGSSNQEAWRDGEGVSSVPGSTLSLGVIPLEDCRIPLILYSRSTPISPPTFICVHEFLCFLVTCNQNLD